MLSTCFYTIILAKIPCQKSKTRVAFLSCQNIDFMALQDDFKALRLIKNNFLSIFSLIANQKRHFPSFFYGKQLFGAIIKNLKFGSQPLSAANDWNLVKFEEWIGKVIEGILLKLLIPWVRKRLIFYYFLLFFLFHVKQRRITWFLSFWNLHIFISFWQIRHLENEGRNVNVTNFTIWNMHDTLF